MSAPPVTVEVDTGLDSDSAYGDEISKYTASLTSTVLESRKENGRTYHGYRDGAYYMPNDENEKERLDMMHELMMTMMGRKLFLSPIGSSPRRVLDLGTGTGVWAIEFADQFPSSEVIGIDLSPIQPSFVPPNVRFIIDDFDDTWVEKDLDFIHGRYLAGSSKDFAKLLRECYNNAAPGGWVEFQEWDTGLFSEDGSTDGTSIKQYYEILNSEFAKIGRVINTGPRLEGWMRDAGFKNIQVKKYLVPMGAWPKDKHLKTLGAWNFVEAESGFEAGVMAVLTRHAGWTKEEVDILVAKTRNDAKNPAIHTLFNFYVVYGQKEE
ncbi:hypothetical protein DTO164E3_8011 [Paecilomyces variotii]|nr:hypothetical protein DTO032I3_8101 [Paecilomyces variotii]KAJ9193187.1 hypothetical protein DTO164E3_8011 [Paecilomyces variotii]KAJ9274938.1 hypothetical protein DTO021D3_8206 [Paecilomyces variotii]KAJ9339394.1 hypothetical protein DTO027B6_8048 [Paecilomyces variotii]KAJ9348847.1 hypothetical protein DTO027B9_7990 [Paecilomyces variotii]